MLTLRRVNFLRYFFRFVSTNATANNFFRSFVNFSMFRINSINFMHQYHDDTTIKMSGSFQTIQLNLNTELYINKLFRFCIIFIGYDHVVVYNILMENAFENSESKIRAPYDFTILHVLSRMCSCFYFFNSFFRCGPQEIVNFTQNEPLRYAEIREQISLSRVHFQ